MTIAILALQGAFAEHQQRLQEIGHEAMLIHNLEEWNRYIQENSPINGELKEKALILPGGESTAMMRIMHDEGLFEPIREAILKGLPVFGTCAGLILLDRSHLGTMDILAKRNAYGRQLGSFATTDSFVPLGSVPMTFIRAPYIEEYGASVKVLATVDGRVIAARQGNQLVTAFHPELDADTRIHRWFFDEFILR